MSFQMSPLLYLAFSLIPLTGWIKQPFLNYIWRSDFWRGIIPFHIHPMGQTEM